MKIKDLKVGCLYVLGHRNKTIFASKINSFEPHEDCPYEEGHKKVRYPYGIEYLHISNDFSCSTNVLGLIGFQLKKDIGACTKVER